MVDTVEQRDKQSKTHSSTASQESRVNALRNER